MSQKVRIGINGFGRIGRKAFRLAWERDDVEIVAINDPSTLETTAHLLRRDSVHGTFNGKIEILSDEGIRVTSAGKEWTVAVFQTRELEDLHWEKHNVDVVLECTGRFRDRKTAGIHLKNGAKKVIISAPGKDPDATIVVGVNDHEIKPSQTLFSNASCTTNCLAPLVKVLDEEFGIISGTMLTVHSYTNDQKVLDLGHSDLRRARACAINMIPTTTGAAKAVGLVLPNMKGKIDGFSVRVPTPNVSLVDLTVNLSKSATKESVNAAFKKASEGPLKGILGYSEDELVSSDFNGNTLSSILDAPSTMVVQDKLVKVISWYDNESGFSARMLDLAQLIGRDA